jgi:predicted RNase H-like HicB family nuclease
MSEAALLDEIIVPIIVEYLEEDNVYKVSCPALPGCYAWGESLDEAMHTLPGNIRAMLEARRSKGSPIPSGFEHATPHTPFILRVMPA